MRISLATLTLLAASLGAASAQTREPFSVEALVANAGVYVAERYVPRELPAALIADLTSADFQCQESAADSECTRVREAAAPCFDVVSVRITADNVAAEQDRRCMGAEE